MGISESVLLNEKTVTIVNTRRIGELAEVTVALVVDEGPHRPPQRFRKLFSVNILPNMTEKEIDLAAIDQAYSFLLREFSSKTV
jgi:hypothetical protein